MTSQHKDLTSQHKYLTSQHKYMTSQHNYLTSDGRNMPPYELLRPWFVIELAHYGVAFYYNYVFQALDTLCDV